MGNSRNRLIPERQALLREHRSDAYRALHSPDTGGQAVYILDQARALEQEMRQRLHSPGLEIEPRILVLTRLIAAHPGSSRGQAAGRRRYQLRPAPGVHRNSRACLPSVTGAHWPAGHSGRGPSSFGAAPVPRRSCVPSGALRV